ncbi:MAG: chalcone isomerase family protein [Rhodoferax sp.]|nr:chalcone isomerase family protein [Rhodoferax sp.]
MKKRAAGALLLAVCMASQAEPVPQELASQVPQAALSGQATMRFLGFEIYRASLWVAPGFAGANYAQNKFALELRYLRNFQGADIAKRSIVEMRRQDGFDAQLAPQWEQQMRALFPNVQTGDRITGVHLPGTGAEFYGNGKLLGEIRDPLFARLFFGIWLSPQTSEPALRKDLLIQANGAAR